TLQGRSPFDTSHQGLANAAQRLGHGLWGSTTVPCYLVDRTSRLIAPRHQRPLLWPEMAQALQQSLLPLVELLQTLLGLVGQLGDQRVVEVFAGACLLLAEGQNLELGNTAGPGHEVAAGLKLAGLLPEDEIAFLQNVFRVRRAMDQSVDEGVQAPLTAA